MNYTQLTHSQYLELVLSIVEERFGKEIDAVFAGLNSKDCALMINDAVVTFKGLNQSPQFAATQVIDVLMSANAKGTKQ